MSSLPSASPAMVVSGAPTASPLANEALKRRARRRIGQRGAVMFIVAMTLAVIATMGIYALKIASTEVQTAGFVRQQVQTTYLSEMGVASMAQALTNNAQTYASVMLQQPDAFCYSLFGISSQATATPQAIACHRAGSPELGAQVVPLGSPPVTLLTPVTSFNAANDATRGPVGINTAPDFFVEVTDPNQRQPPAGYATNSSSPVCFLEVTASSMGITPTTFTANAATDSSGFRSEGLEMARARIVFGPVQCTGTN